MEVLSKSWKYILKNVVEKTIDEPSLLNLEICIYIDENMAREILGNDKYRYMYYYDVDDLLEMLENYKEKLGKKFVWHTSSKIMIQA